jgi:hypothetical protein
MAPAADRGNHHCMAMTIKQLRVASDDDLIEAHDEVASYQRLGRRSTLDLPVVPVRPTGSGCTPSPGRSGSASPTTSSPTWHGAGFHPYSFMHLDVLAWAFGP